MTREKFENFVRQLTLLNPETHIGISSKTTSVIWADVPVGELVLPPMVVCLSGQSGQKLKFDRHIVEVLDYGQYPEYK